VINLRRESVKTAETKQNGNILETVNELDMNMNNKVITY
jgi:hypothetical protein